MSQGIKTIIRGLRAGKVTKVPSPVEEKPAATKPKEVAGKGKQFNATK